MGIDLVPCNPIPVYGNLITGVATAAGVVMAVAGFALNNTVLVGLGTTVAVVGGLSLLRCFDKPLGAVQQVAEGVTPEVAKEFIEKTFKPEEIIEGATKSIVSEVVSEVVR